MLGIIVHQTVLISHWCGQATVQETAGSTAGSLSVFVQKGDDDEANTHLTWLAVIVK